MFFGFPFFLRRFLIALAHMIWDLTLFYVYPWEFQFPIFLDFPRKTMGTKEAFSEYFLASIFYLDQCEGHTFSKICDLTFFPSAFDHISIFHFCNFFKKKKGNEQFSGIIFFASNNSSDIFRGHTF